MCFVTAQRTRLTKFRKNVISFAQDTPEFAQRVGLLCRYGPGDRVNTRLGSASGSPYVYADGRYACGNAFTYNMLRNWSSPPFEGFMVSDYLGTRSTAQAANAGLDMQLPGCVTPDPKDPLQCLSDPLRQNFFGAPLKAAVLNGSVPVAAIDKKVLRILTPMYAIGLFDEKNNHSRKP